MYLQELFNHMSDQHGLTLLESEMFDIIEIVRKIENTVECDNCGDNVEKIVVEEICPSCLC